LLRIASHCFAPPFLDGTPSCANGKINNKVYRDTYKWDGFMVSDCDSVGGFKKFPNVHANNVTKAAAIGISGGLDVDCGLSYASITGAVQEGLVPEKAVRQAARRFLAKQIGLGTLEHTPWDKVPATAVDSPAHRALALETAQQSLVLLRNEPSPSPAGGSGGASGAAASPAPVLPFSKSTKLALLGPHAMSTEQLLGNYHGVNLQILNASIVAAATKYGLQFTYSAGTESLTKPNATAQAEAVAMAKQAEVAVVFVGLDESLEGEGHDRSDLQLPPAQIELVAQVAAVQPKTVVVLINGGALAIEGLFRPLPPMPPGNRTGNCTVYDGFDIAHGSNIPAPCTQRGVPSSPAQCCDCCANTTGCKAFSVVTSDDNKCYLHGESGSLTPRADCTSGVIGSLTSTTAIGDSASAELRERAGKDLNGAANGAAHTVNATLVPAVVEAFYPGQAGAEAIVQALLGETNRFGRLPYTVYPATFTKRDMQNFDLQVCVRACVCGRGWAVRLSVYSVLRLCRRF
jgi:hypothetical protein